MSEFSHLKNKLLAEQVEDQIYHYILDEALEPGAKLPNEFALGEKFRVGRSTIREAVKLLSSKGIVEVRQGSGTYVVTTVKGLSDPLNLRSVQDKNALAFDLVNVRLLLEPGIAEMAAQNATPEDIHLYLDRIARGMPVASKAAAMSGDEITQYLQSMREKKQGTLPEQD